MKTASAIKSIKDLPEQEQFIDEVNQFMILADMTRNKLAKSAGISSATLSQFLNGKYPGDYSAIRTKITTIINRENEKSKLSKRNTSFIETSVSKRFFDIAKTCHHFCEIGVCYSAAGLGKTESAREYVQRNDDCILLEADPSYTAGVMLRELHSKLYNESGKKDIHGTFSDCVERLKKSGRMLIIDEAEKLPYRALEFVRRIHDKSGIGILLTGMPQLLGNLRGIRGQFAQLYSRVGMAVKLETITERDTELIVERMAPGAETLYKIFHHEAEGNTRRLMKIISRATHIAELNDIPIDTGVITSASKLVRVEVMS
jgi:DNA transposition AAA+ family ATPase